MLTTSYPLPHCRAQKRVAQQRIHAKLPLTRIIDLRKKIFGQVKVIGGRPSLARAYSHQCQRFGNLGSQIGDDRPISQVRFSPNSKVLATGSWSGAVKIWNVPACTPIRTLRGEHFNSLRPAPRNNMGFSTGHADRVGGVAWHPQATLTQGEGLVNLVSGAGDMSVNLWSLSRCAASDAPPKSRH